MTEIKKELTPEQIFEGQVKKMSDEHISRRMRRLVRTPSSNIDSIWAIALSIVFDNTKPIGKMEPFLR